MLPHPRIIPSVMFGHHGFSWGQCSLARCHIALTGVALQCMRMCVIDSGTWHVGQFCRSLYPGICDQKCPIFWVSCIALYRNCLILILIIGFCSPHHMVLSVSRVCVYSAIAICALSRLFNVAGRVYGPLCSRMPLYAIACDKVASFAPCKSNSFGISRFSSSGFAFSAPSFASWSLPSFPSSLLCLFTHLNNVGADRLLRR